jgi:hypothetical protein
MADDNDEREPTPDERLAMDWWNAMTQEQRQIAMHDAREVLGYDPSVADVWNLRVAGDIAGPPVPPGARPPPAPPPPKTVTTAEWRKRLRAAVRPVSDEEERFVQWMAGWGTSTAETFLAILERARRERS